MPSLHPLFKIPPDLMMLPSQSTPTPVTQRRVRVTAPSRLHFGLLSFGHANRRQFGGAGVMVDAPGLELDFVSSDNFSVTGPLADRVAFFTRQVQSVLNCQDAMPIHIHVRRAPPDHMGLGTGTQLGMSVAAGLHAIWGLAATHEQLSATVGRGKRSAIGVHGFRHGGLIVESGKLPDEPLGRLIARVALPNAWRFVLLTPPHAPGISGEKEQYAFAQLPPVSRQTTACLQDEIESRLLPAARAGDFHAFSNSIYKYGLTAGQCFASQQGGPFASAAIQGLVQVVRQFGVSGVGQSSWGPTLFALLPDHHSAEHFVAEWARHPSTTHVATQITTVNNHGARIQHFGPYQEPTEPDPNVADAPPIAPRAGRSSDG